MSQQIVMLTEEGALEFLQGQIFTQVVTGLRHCDGPDCSKKIKKGVEAVCVRMGSVKDGSYVFFHDEDCRKKFEAALFQEFPQLAD